MTSKIDDPERLGKAMQSLATTLSETGERLERLDDGSDNDELAELGKIGGASLSLAEAYDEVGAALIKSDS